MSDVVIIDNGGANIASVRFALERLGATADLSANPDRIRAASHVILPGVGMAGDAIERLRAAKLDSFIPTLKQPVLGICLGMQLYFASSAEGDAKCLGIIPGRAERFDDAVDYPVPHMGWNSLDVRAASPLLKGVESGAYVYFVHSYALPVSNGTIATTNYGKDFSAVVRQDNFHGVQFHPERSGTAGARILSNFLELA